jgi:ABC-type transporter Mla MlaB component
MTEETRSKYGGCRRPQADSSPGTLTLTIRGPLARADLPGLIERTCALLSAGPVDVLWCELIGVAPDAVAVDALARLALAARRCGTQVRMRGASEEMRALVAFIGLAEVLGG